jgi:hypothetical protein
MEDLYSLVMPLGIATYVVLLVTFLVGLRVIKVKFKIHKVLAIITLLLASLHAILILYLNYSE